MSWGARHLLLLSPNWLGDGVMALPAFQAWRAAQPTARVTVLAKPSVAPLWSLVDGIDDRVTLPPGTAATWRTGRLLRAGDYDAALLLPPSFRAAWLAWLAHIPRRRGVAGQGRGGLLTERVALTGLAAAHQQREVARLFALADDAPLAPPRLNVPAAAVEAVVALTGLPAAAPRVAILPGAARGEAKRWPADHFVAACRRVATIRPETRFVVCGAAAEAPACAAVAAGVGPTAVDLCGRTTLPQLAALLAGCRAVCCNDSGGMHLAAAVGAPVVAIFGLTDPRKTGPLGAGNRVLTLPGARHARALPRVSPEAARVLAAIAPERVAEALLEVLAP